MNIHLSRVAAAALIGLSFGLAGCGRGSDMNAADAQKIEALKTRIATLDAEARQIQDSNDIKKLQRAYGYYLDQADWDNVLNLLTDDATAEYGHTGVYAGKDHIKAFLYAINEGRSGLKEGQLNEHFQLQPEVDIAPDGKTAKGRWMMIGMIGQYKQSASWEGGIYEDEYRKEDGVWKISKIHWYETYTVPYDGAWAKKLDDAAPAAQPANFPAPDMPPSEDYKSWPGNYLPPFHFENPGRVAPIKPEVSGMASDGDDSLEALQTKAAALAQEVQLLEDHRDIEKLQRAYGFYVDKAMWHQVADLYAKDGTLEIGGRGVFVGHDRILQYLEFLGPEFPMEGRLYNHIQLQPIVDVAPDGKTAKGRWRFLAEVGEWQKSQNWGLGTYENEYVKEDGVWKIKTLHGYFRMYTPYEDGWGKTAMPNTRPEKDLPPDLPPTVVYDTYPAVYFPPFHYENPVTGADAGKSNVTPSTDAVAAMGDTADDLDKALDGLGHRLDLLEDHRQLENLHSVYGYYLAKWRWDDLTDLFAENGKIEIAQRGVYIGKASVRRNLDLYGTQGIHDGTLHDHIQIQPIIDVAPDGQTAKMRARALSQLGYYGRVAILGDGVYESDFVKENGIWKFANDHVFTTFFAPYDKGWAYGANPAPPGISKDNPPDAPPSVVYQAYPKVFLPPYHYNNPVTGKPATIE